MKTITKIAASLAGLTCALALGDQTAPWPQATGPASNYLPLEENGFSYIDHPTQAKRLWESEVQHFGFGKSLSSPVSKFYDLEQRYPGTHSGNGGTPVIAEGLLFFNSLRPAGPADEIIHEERTLPEIERKVTRSIERGMDPKEARALGERAKLMWRKGAEDLYFALDPKTGELKWEVTKPGVNLPNGKRDIWKPSPAYHKGKVFALGTTGIVRAFELKSGKMLWETDLAWTTEPLKRVSFELDLVAADGRVIIPGPRPLALDAETGEMVWKFEDKKVTVQGKWANPSLWIHQDKSYLLYTDGHFENATLRLVDAATGAVVWERLTGGPMADPPLLVGDVAFVTVAGKEHTYPHKGQKKTALLPVRGGMRLSLKGPEELWRFPEDDVQFTYSPTPDKGVRRNASAGRDGVLYFFPNGAPVSPRFIYKINAQTGEILAKSHQADETPERGSTKAPYVYEIGDHLLHFPSGAGGDHHFGRTNFRSSRSLEKVGDGVPFEQDNPNSNYEVFSEHPIADGRIYIRTYAGTIVCWDLRKEGP